MSIKADSLTDLLRSADDQRTPVTSGATWTTEYLSDDRPYQIMSKTAMVEELSDVATVCAQRAGELKRDLESSFLSSQPGNFQHCNAGGQAQPAHAAGLLYLLRDRWIDLADFQQQPGQTNFTSPATLRRDDVLNCAAFGGSEGKAVDEDGSERTYREWQNLRANRFMANGCFILALNLNDITIRCKRAFSIEPMPHDTHTVRLLTVQARIEVGDPTRHAIIRLPEVVA